MAYKIKDIYPSQTTTGDAGWPDGKPRNIQGGVQGTGTPFEEKLFQDYEGSRQALFDEAGIEPSGQADRVGQSDFVGALKKVANQGLFGKIFQSPTDGELTEIQTRTVNANEVYEVRKTSDNSLATIYSNAAGTIEIVQNGTSNVSNSDGVIEFYIADGDYTVTINEISAGFSVGHNGLTGRNLAGAHDSIYYRSSTVAEVASGVFAAESLLRLADRNNCKFKVVSGGIPNGLDILDAGNGNTAILLSEGGEVVVECLGAVNADSLNRSVDILDTGNQTITGGYIEIPIGSFAVDETIDITNSEAERLVGVTISGKGKQGTTLDFSSSTSGDGLSFGGAFSAVEDLAIKSAKASALKLKIDNAKAWNHFNARRVRAGFSAGHSVHAEQGFMGHFEQVFATHAQAGFSGFKFDGLHTSLHFNNCYAASNSANGYDFTRVFYSAVTASASDSNGQHGYRSQNSHSLVYNGSGSESNGRSGWYSVSSSTLGSNEITLNNCFAFKNNAANAGWANLAHVQAIDGVSNKVVVRGSKSQDPANPISDIIVDGLGAYLVDEDNNLPNGAISRNKGYIHHVNRTKVVHGLSVTAATNVVELANPQGHQTDFGGTITVVATNADPSSASTKNSATYHLLVDKGVQGGVVVEIAKAGLTSGAGAYLPSFTWNLSGSFLTATPIGSTSGVFTFQVLSGGAAVKIL